MQDPIITSLQSFPKPDANFVKNKDCLICLESIDVESQKIVGFPCKCANSVYHTDCVVTFLYSGQDKNFCPHCKIKYNLIQPSSPPPEPIPNLQIHKIKHIFVIHMITNTTMNILNISLTTDTDIMSKILIILYFVKLLCNSYFIINSKDVAVEPLPIIDHNSYYYDKINNYMFISYFFQTILFVYIVAVVILSNNDIMTAFLLYNNILFNCSDAGYRIYIYHH